MRISPIPAIILVSILLFLPACQELEAQHSEAQHSVAPHSEGNRTIVVTSPDEQDVISTQEYVCQIHSRRHIEIRSMMDGYLEEIRVKEGQEVKQGQAMFEILPVLYRAKLDSEKAEAQLAQIEFNNTKRLFEQRLVSDQEVALAKAKLAKTQAHVNLARAELNFTVVNAPFNGIIDRLEERKGSLIEAGDLLTTLSDNDVMWVYFNVPEANYLEYMANLRQDQDADEDPGETEDEEEMQIELELANGEIFPYAGKLAAIEADFNNETGTVAFRADFPNPDHLLRHHQTGTVLIHRVMDDAIVIPQRAVFEILAKRYVYVVDDDHVVHQREIAVQYELEDIFVIKTGLDANDKIVLEGVRQVRDGDKVEYEFRAPEEILDDLKYHAE